MGRKPGRTFVEKDFKKNGVILITVLLVTVIIIALVSLIPSQTPQMGDLSRNGVSRSFMFPVAYKDEHDSLKVIDSALHVSAVDDSVSDAVHDFQKGKIYYLRENVLYEYDIKQNNRRILIGGGVADYRVLNDRSAIVYLTTAGELSLYDYADKKSLVLCKCGDTDHIERLVMVGRSGFLYFADISQKDNQGTLYYSDNEGNTRKISEHVQLETARISPHDRYFVYKKEACLYITDFKGKEIANCTGASLIESTKQAMAFEALNDISTFNQGIEISYTYRIEKNGGVVEYFTGDGLKAVDDQVIDIIYYSEESDRLFYTIPSEEPQRIELMMSVRGGAPRKVVTAGEDSTFIWCESTGKIFCLDGGNLYRINVFDDFALTQLASGVSTMRLYPGKEFIVYTDAMYNNYYVLSDQSTEQVAAGAVRLYGITNNTYLLQSTYNGAHMSLDLVQNDSMQRLDSDVDVLVCFDNNFSNVLYKTWEGLVLRNEEGAHTVDTTGAVSLVELKS